ncbi:hypothetical protein NL676_005482 [Syzygium grande]|nr:hypothetical protein NL676_005482 [Syzygium grande]
MTFISFAVPIFSINLFILGINFTFLKLAGPVSRERVRTCAAKKRYLCRSGSFLLSSPPTVQLPKRPLALNFALASPDPALLLRSRPRPPSAVRRPPSAVRIHRASQRKGGEMSDLCQFPGLELQAPAPAPAPAPGSGSGSGSGAPAPAPALALASASTLAAALFRAPSASSSVPVRKGNLSQFPQPELSPAEPALALALALAPPSSQAPMEAQAFDPSLRVPVRMENLSQFPQPELPLAEPTQAPAQASAPASAPVLSSSQTPKQAQAFDPSLCVPIRMENLTQFPQPELPLLESFSSHFCLHLRLPSKLRHLTLLYLFLSERTIIAPMQAQAFDPSLLAPARINDLGEFSQPELPLAIPAEAVAPPSTRASEQAQVSCPPSCVPEQVMYKNRLQEYTQKIMVHFPIYKTINEGSQHAPRYRSTVFEAEQNVAQIALDLLSQKMKDEGCPLIHEDAIFCKSILNEYAPQGTVPVFVSYLVFNGVTYTGDVGKSKKEAEQLAARAAIQSLYDDSQSKIVLLKTIKSKWKLYATHRETKYSGPLGENVTENVGGNSEISNTNHGEASRPANNVLGRAIPQACSEVPTPHHLFQIPRAVAEASSTVENSLISFVPSRTEQQPIAAANSSKKRRKNKKKANKKPRVDPEQVTQCCDAF